MAHMNGSWHRRMRHITCIRSFHGISTFALDGLKLNILQHTATHRNTLQLTATQCNTLQHHTATHCSTALSGSNFCSNFIPPSKPSRTPPLLDNAGAASLLCRSGRDAQGAGSGRKYTGSFNCRDWASRTSCAVSAFCVMYTYIQLYHTHCNTVEGRTSCALSALSVMYTHMYIYYILQHTAT